LSSSHHPESIPTAPRSQSLSMSLPNTKHQKGLWEQGIKKLKSEKDLRGGSRPEAKKTYSNRDTSWCRSAGLRPVLSSSRYPLSSGNFECRPTLNLTSQKIGKTKVGSGCRIDFRTSFYDFETSFGQVSPPSLQLYVCYVPFTSNCSCIQKEKGTKSRSRSESNSRPNGGYSGGWSREGPSTSRHR
jgi:hypothetical protein